MALNPKLAPDPALILLVVVFMVIGCVEMGYLLILLTIIHDYKRSRILAAFADLSLSWRWWLPITCGMQPCSETAGAPNGSSLPPCAANTGRQTLQPLAAKARDQCRPLENPAYR